MKKLGVVGLGTIGRSVVLAADRGEIPFHIAGAHHRHPETSASFRASLKWPISVLGLEELITRSDLVFEAASRPAVEQICEIALPQGKDVVVASVGALLERPDLIDLARQHGARIYAPSGGMIGLDG